MALHPAHNLRFGFTDSRRSFPFSSFQRILRAGPGSWVWIGLENLMTFSSKWEGNSITSVQSPPSSTNCRILATARSARWGIADMPSVRGPIFGREWLKAEIDLRFVRVRSQGGHVAIRVSSIWRCCKRSIFRTHGGISHNQSWPWNLVTYRLNYVNSSRDPW